MENKDITRDSQAVATAYGGRILIVVYCIQRYGDMVSHLATSHHLLILVDARVRLKSF